MWVAGLLSKKTSLQAKVTALAMQSVPRCVGADDISSSTHWVLYSPVDAREPPVIHVFQVAAIAEPQHLQTAVIRMHKIFYSNQSPSLPCRKI